MLSPKTIDIVKEITPLVADHAELITRRFYERLFDENPEVQDYFNPAHQHSGGQQRALAGAICAYFVNIDNLPALGPAVNLIAHKHCSLGIQPEHYPIVGKHLLAAIKDIMGDAATDEIIQAVAEAYGVLAEVCIGREAEIYQEQKDAPGGWNGYRTFVVEQKVAECESITSIYLKPSDGGAVPSYLPGQYITVCLEPSENNSAANAAHGCPFSASKYRSLRNYSLSQAPHQDAAQQAHYRISVKREHPLSPDSPAGVVSNYLHDKIQIGDTVQVGPPCGEFVMDPQKENGRDVVLIAGGVGITPLLAMAQSLRAKGDSAPQVHLIYSVRNSKHHAFAEELKLLQSDGSFQITVLYDEPLPTDQLGTDCQRIGRVDRGFLEQSTPISNADYYLCGPKPFMLSICDALKELGVTDDRIAYEFFGPKGM